MSGSGPQGAPRDSGAPDFSRSQQTDGTPRPLLVCVHCGFTYAEFRARGLLGCPSCYDHFGDALRADMLHIHPRLHRRAPAANETRPGGAENSIAENAAALREQLSDALRLERYEAAAALRRQLDALSGTGPRLPASAPGGADRA